MDLGKEMREYAEGNDCVSRSKTTASTALFALVCRFVEQVE